MLTFEIDEEDYIKLSIHSERFYFNGRVLTLQNPKTRKMYRIPRLILGCGEDDGMDAEHIDRNIFNNKKSNLRWATTVQNQGNVPKTKRPTSSKYKGVYWDKKRLLWCASIRLHGRKKYLGSYNLEEDAAKVYDKAALNHFGEFAWLNFPIKQEVICV